MKPTVNTLWPLLTLSLLLLVTPALTACGPKALVVHPAEPLPAPKVAVPKAASDPVKLPTWLQ